MNKVTDFARSPFKVSKTAPKSGSSISKHDQHIARICQSLNVDPAQAGFVASVFDAAYYRRQANLSTHDASELLEHYLSVGINQNLAPSVWFDPAHVCTSLGLDADHDTEITAPDAVDDAPVIQQSAMKVWIQEAFSCHTLEADEQGRYSGIAWFDEHFYRSTYPDIDENIANGYVHFISNGRQENRFPCEWLMSLVNTAMSHFPDMHVSVVQLIASVPGEHLPAFCTGQFQSELQQLFIPPLYLGSLGLDAGVPDDALQAHYLVQGWSEGHRPSVLFNDAWYRTQLAKREDISPIDQNNPYLHWYFLGRAADIVPTPMFESHHYLDVHADIRRGWNEHAFEHYIRNGISEHGRSGSVHFDNSYYKSVAGKLDHVSPLVDYVVRGQHLGLAPSADIDISCFPAENPWQSSPAEEAAIRLSTKIARLDAPHFQHMLEDIERLEPQIVRPYGPRKVRMPPMVHPEAPLMLEAAPIASIFAGKQYDSIVLIPHCRMAGSAKVSGALVNALGNVTDRSRILIVTTDLSVFERSGWFPEDIDLFDFSEHMDNVPTERRARALLDLVRGLRPKRLININSNLGWHLTNNYGRQLAEWMNLYVYLFCWDLDFKGNKGGYPIQWFQPTFDHCSGVFTDDATLRSELVNRYAPSKALADRFVTLYEPATDRDIDYGASLAQRATLPGKRRVFWCGRFDRQKRLDLLVAIAEAMPDVEFLVWGKRVMDDGPDYLETPPENIRLMGAYTCIDDVPIASCDAFLYTSAWDGMPSVLIEMASRNVAIVASNVGGVAELIHDDTGWLIDDVENVSAYVDAVQELLENPLEAVRRAASLREHTLSLCTHERYEASIGDVLSRERPHDLGIDRVFERPVALHDGIVSDSANSPDSKAMAGTDEKIDLTAILTAHGEGSLAAVSYRNFETACLQAEATGLRVERMIMLDNADRQTKLVFDDVPGNVRLVETAFGDQGAVRNLAAELCSGEFIAFIDGDDLWSENWLSEGVRYLQGAPENVIAHPEFCTFFSGVRSVFVNIDQDDPAFRMDFLRHANYWDAMCMARRSTHLAHPYCTRRISDGFAFEDWHWNCETIDGGHVHKVVNDTMHLKRRRASSQTTKASSNRSLMPLTSLTDYALLTPASVETVSKQSDVSVGRVA